MAGSDGVITQKDIIEDKALTIGTQYAKNMELAIAANKGMVSSLKEVNDLADKFKNATTQSEYISLKNQQTLATQKLIGEIKAQEAAEIALQKIEQEKIRTGKILLDAENKEATAKKKNTKLTAEERVQLEYNNRVLKEAAVNNLNLGSAYTKLNRERTNAKKALLDLLAAEKQDTAAIKEATKAFADLDKRVRAADHAVGDFHKTVGNYPKLTAFTGGLKNLIAAFGVTGGISAFAAILSDAYKTIKEFEQSIADLQSITGATGADLTFLKNSAIDLGQKVAGGAKAVVEAYKLIASAKPELLDNVKALNQVTDSVITLAQAGGIELPDAATALTGALNQFGADAEQSAEFIDALANGAKYGSIEIAQTTDALLKFGAVAKNSGVSIQESVAAIQILGPSFKSAEEAGTGFRNIMLKITAPDALPKQAFKQLSAALKESGYSIDKLKDKSIPFAEKLEALKPLLKDNSKLVTVFGTENVTAATALLKQVDAFEELIPKIHEFGTAEEQAEIRMNTLNGKTEKLKSTYDSLILSIGNGSGVISEFFKFFIDGAAGALQGLIRLNSSWDDLYEKAKNSGSTEGSKSFSRLFAGLVGEKMTDAERNKIRDRIKEINEAIAAGYDDPSLMKEKGSLLQRLGTGDDDEVAASIRKSALNQRKVLVDEYLKNQEAIIEAEKGGFFKRNVLSSTADRDKLKKEKERLIKAIAEQNQIIVDAQNKIRSVRNPKATPDAPDTTDTGMSDKERKKLLKAQKELNDALYELERQRLERIIKINGEIAEDQKLKDDVRIAAVQNVNAKEIELAELTKQHKLDADNFVLKEDLLNENQKLFIHREFENKKTDVTKKAQQDIEKIREFDEKYFNELMNREVTAIEISNNDKIIEEEKRYQKELALGYKNQKQKEKAAEKHEENLFNIKKESLLKATKLQLFVLQKEIDAYAEKANEDGKITQEESDFILDKRKKLSDLSVKLVEAEGSHFKDNENEKADTVAKRIAKWYTDNEKAINDIADISRDSLSELQGLNDALAERNIQKIDEEIDKNNEFYEKQIKLAGDNDKQKALLEAERDKKNAELEKKKRKEQEKAAKFNKAITIAQIAITTALAVMKGFADSGWVGAILAAALGAISLATAIATPIPKYKMGRVGGKKEKAIINDGGVPEVVESKDGTAKIYEGKNRLVQLLEGDTVHRSVEDYTNTQRKKLLNNVDAEGKKLNEFQKMIIINDKRDPELISEIRLLRKSVERNKPLKSEKTQSQDLSHALWKARNLI